MKPVEAREQQPTYCLPREQGSQHIELIEKEPGVDLGDVGLRFCSLIMGLRTRGTQANPTQNRTDV